MTKIKVNRDNIYEGDIVKVSLIRQGSNLRPVGSPLDYGGLFLPKPNQDDCLLSGAEVDEVDIIRGNREKVQFEVLRKPEPIEVGDILFYENNTTVIAYNNSMVWSTTNYGSPIARILRPIK
jgi:hypothetical protein